MRRHDRYGHTIASQRHMRLCEAARRGPQTGRQRQIRLGVTSARQPDVPLAHHARTPRRLLLLDAPPAPPLRTGQHLDTRHRTVSRTGAKIGV